MTWLWFLLWIGLSAVILGSFFWSTIILQKQKKAWSDFAKKHNLKYEGGRFMESPSITGPMDGYNVSVFSALRDPDDVKARRYVSVIELKLPGGLAGSSAAGTKDMVGFMKTLTALSPYEIDSPHWNKEHKFFTKDPAITKAYLDNTRLRHLSAILSLKNADVMMMFDDDEGVVRVETSDPIQEVAKAERVISHLINNLGPLLLDDKQRRAVKDRAAQDNS